MLAFSKTIIFFNNTVCYQSVRYRKFNGTCAAQSEWTNGRVSLSGAFGEFSLFNTLLIYNDSVKLNLSFKDLCHFMNVSLLAVLFFFISSLNHWPWQLRKISVTSFAKGSEKSTFIFASDKVLMLRYLWITYCTTLRKSTEAEGLLSRSTV